MIKSIKVNGMDNTNIAFEDDSSRSDSKEKCTEENIDSKDNFEQLKGKLKGTDDILK